MNHRPVTKWACSLNFSASPLSIGSLVGRVSSTVRAQFAVHSSNFFSDVFDHRIRDVLTSPNYTTGLCHGLCHG